jgi:hypothetical protein
MPLSALGSDLVSVEIETHLGALYTFPDVPAATLETFLTHSAWEQINNVVLVNVSGASLAVPLRVVRVIRVAGKERLRRDQPEPAQAGV